MDNDKVSDELNYWFFAHHFGYTPDQVDKLPFDRGIYTIELEQEYKRQEKQAMKNGG